MIGATIVMGMIAMALLAVSYYKDPNLSLLGLKGGLGILKMTLPLLFFAFITAGLIQVLIPQDLVRNWVGNESGWKGIIIGTLAGSLAPGGPYVSLPLAAGLLKAGAGLGTMVSFIAGWALLGLTRIPMEVGILGWRFTVIRLGCTFFFPPLAGMLANLIVRNFSNT